MKRSELQCEACMHYVGNQNGDLKGIMELNNLQCTRGADPQLSTRCTQYSPIEGIMGKKQKDEKGRGKRVKPFRHSNVTKTVAIACVTICVLLAGASTGICQPPSPWTGNMNFLFGERYLEEEDWKPLEDQTQIGLFLDFRHEQWPVNVALGYSISSADDTRVIVDPWLGPVSLRGDAEIRELDIGVRKILGEKKLAHVRPFIGGGIAMVWAHMDVEVMGIGASASDDDIGFWIDGGAYMTVGSFNVGFDVKWTKATVELEGVNTDAGGVQVGAFIGLHW